jgi:penicillin-binding protein 1A
MIGRYLRFVTDSDRSRLWRLIVGVLGLAGAGALALAVTLVVLIPLTPSMGSLKNLKVQHPTVVKSAGGETLAQFGRQNREWVPRSEIDTTVVQALVMAEDHRFYEHSGVDPRRLAGAVARTLMGDLQGGSTLTMQLARNLYPESIGRAFAPWRKLKEIVTALKIERAYSKDEIIETYLNTVPYLYGAHGIERGAEMYFDKSADALEMGEAATLVGMLRAIAYYNPHRNPEQAKARRNVVLSQMEKRGAITEEEYDALRQAPLGVDFSLPPARPGSKAPHFTARLRERLLRWAESRGHNIYTDGLLVRATLDLELQEMAEKAVRRQGAALQAVADVQWGRESDALLSESASPYRDRRVEDFGHFWETKDALVNDFIRSTRRYERSVAGDYTPEQALEALRADAAFMDSLRQAKTRLEAGLVALAPQGAAVRAYVGSRNFEKEEYDHAGIARRQPGSTFKPFVYATALKEGHEPSDTFKDEPVTIRTASDQTWRPQNASGTASGEQLSLSDGLARSKNTVTSRVVKEVGAGDVAETAREMGVRRSDLAEVPSLALGTSSVTLLEMTSAYATLARGGVYQEPRFMRRIENRDGEVLRVFEPEGERVLSEKVAAQVTEMMRGVVERGTGQAVRDGWGIRADVAGKTGTTQGGADGWFLLMHPELVAGAWAGFNDPRVAFRTGHWGQGGNNALRVTAHLFQQALRQGALSAEPQLAPAPGAEEDGEDGGFSLVAQAGAALESAAEGAAEAAATAARSAGRAVAGAVSGWLNGGSEDEAPPAPEEQPPRAENRSASPEQQRAQETTEEEEPTEEAQPRTWNESADERRGRMEDYWREVREGRRREIERRRERLENYYQEMEQEVEDTLSGGEDAPEASDPQPREAEPTPPDTARAPADTTAGDEDNQRVGW